MKAPTGPSPKRTRRRHREDPVPALFPTPPKSSATVQRPAKRRRVCNSQALAPPDSDDDDGSNECETDDNDGSSEHKTFFTPGFWDNLSRIPLTSSAIRELDRRNEHAPTKAGGEEPTPSGPDVGGGSSLLRFARHGGPDLSDLRGFEDLEDTPPAPDQPTRVTLVRVHKPRGDKKVGRGGQGSRSDSRSAKKKSTSPYDASFKQHLIDYRIWPIDHYLETGEEPPEPDNLQDLARELAGEPGTNGRGPFEPDAFTHDDFKRLQKTYKIAAAEEARSRTLDAVEGSLSLSSSHVKRGPFKSMRIAALTPDNLVPGNPDRAYGSRPEELLPSVRRALANLILPTAAQDLLCPNFVLHVKGPNGDPEVAKLQAVYDGALAARGMEAIRTYASNGSCSNAINGSSTARTIACYLVDGVLRMYAVHLYQPAGVKGVAYSTTRLGSWFLYDDVQQFRRGAAAFRNGLEWARRQREEAIMAANAAANAAGSGDGQENDDIDAGGGHVGTEENNDSSNTNDEGLERVAVGAA